MTRRTLGCVPLKRERVVERAVVAQAVRLGGYANWDNAGSRYLNANNSVRNTNRNNGGSAQTLGNLKKNENIPNRCHHRAHEWRTNLQDEGCARCASCTEHRVACGAVAQSVAARLKDLKTSTTTMMDNRVTWQEVEQAAKDAVRHHMNKDFVQDFCFYWELCRACLWRQAGYPAHRGRRNHQFVWIYLQGLHQHDGVYRGLPQPIKSSTIILTNRL